MSDLCWTVQFSLIHLIIPFYTHSRRERFWKRPYLDIMAFIFEMIGFCLCFLPTAEPSPRLMSFRSAQRIVGPRLLTLVIVQDEIGFANVHWAKVYTDQKAVRLANVHQDTLRPPP